MTQCGYANKGLCVLPMGKIAPCCVINTGPLEYFKGLDQFFEGQPFSSIRNANENNNVLASNWCSMCKLHEDRGEISLRQRLVNNPIKDTSETIVPRLLDISFGNTCNLDCVMCSQDYSSKWASTHGKNPEVAELIGHPTGAKSSTLSYTQIDKILSISPNLERVIIKGGEPLYDKKALYFLEKLQVLNKNVTLNLVTNLTLLTDKTLKILSNYKNINVIVSIDGMGDVYKWIRGYDWDIVDKNIQKCIDKNIKTSIQFTITAFNIAQLEDTYKYYKQKGLRANFIFANQPWVHYSNVGVDKLKNIVANVTAPVEIPIIEPEDSERFIQFTNIMNKQRDLVWDDIC